MALLAKHTAATYPRVTAVAVNTVPYHNAGCTESQDLAISMATAVHYLKAMLAAGMDIDAACKQILFTYSVPCDQFLGIAKLRAARKLFSRIAEACGASEPARAMTIHAVTAADLGQVGTLPKGWLEKSKLPSLKYESLAALVGEKFPWRIEKGASRFGRLAVNDELEQQRWGGVGQQPAEQALGAVQPSVNAASERE
jgi:hypothetical protein